MDVKVTRHPTRQQLVAYAESLVDRRASVSAALASHITSCPQCTHEIRKIRGSFEFTGAAHGLEPSADLTAQILLEAKRARQAEEEVLRWRSPFWTFCQSACSLAALIALGSVMFHQVLQAQAPQMPKPSAIALEETLAAGVTLERATDQIRVLSSAVQNEESQPTSLQERERWRMVGAIGADIAAARAALERNPGCVRATHIVNANIQRGAETLRDLYVEQSF